MADELIDIYDENMNFLGTAPKSQAHKEGLWHMTFHCWIVKKASDGHHRIWLQLRSKEKDCYPSLLDTSAAGHLRSGEKPKDGIREVEEEIGLQIPPDNLTKLFTDKKIAPENNCEFAHTYLFETDKNISNLKLQAEEVDGIVEASVDDLINLFNRKVEKVFVTGLMKNEENQYLPHTGFVTAADFVPHGDNYYLKVMTTIKRFCNGGE